MRHRHTQKADHFHRHDEWAGSELNVTRVPAFSLNRNRSFSFSQKKKTKRREEISLKRLPLHLEKKAPSNHNFQLFMLIFHFLLFTSPTPHSCVSLNGKARRSSINRTCVLGLLPLTIESRTVHHQRYRFVRLIHVSRIHFMPCLDGAGAHEVFGFCGSFRRRVCQNVVIRNRRESHPMWSSHRTWTNPCWVRHRHV